eukprot:gnl/TRDRNA2_/TRDRNA2_128063_c0_seq3.p1 gnl/TRDRNA2_/TRDRNA2_128063_c0~~gnl/TRDRNA2_/TRDRNA2_128063_c0_seq3.p1  ORF type:complete len:168 (+),score=26.90 gnl/TRDRNA2_/TRDRNA2_128063_c0_seq3:56-559(+)
MARLAGILEHGAAVAAPKPTELWLILDSAGRPSGDGLAIWGLAAPNAALECADLLRCGRELRVECCEDDRLAIVSRGVRCSPVAANQLPALAENAIPFPPTPELIDELRIDGLHVRPDDWFCAECFAHQRDEACCSVCGASAAGSRACVLNAVRAGDAPFGNSAYQR